jgi:hypothetical protein
MVFAASYLDSLVIVYKSQSSKNLLHYTAIACLDRLGTAAHDFARPADAVRTGKYHAIPVLHRDSFPGLSGQLTGRLLHRITQTITTAVPLAKMRSADKIILLDYQIGNFLLSLSLLLKDR